MILVKLVSEQAGIPSDEKKCTSIPGQTTQSEMCTVGFVLLCFVLFGLVLFKKSTCLKSNP